MDKLSCENFWVIFKNGFDDSLKKYPVDTHDFHHVLIINEKVYPGYDGYGLYQGSRNEKTVRILQSKSTTTVEKENLK